MNSYNIHKCVQDPFGFIWVASQDGLYRFDGTNFNEYNKITKDSKRKIIGPDCRDLFVDTARQYLWVLLNEGGLNAVNYQTGNVEKAIIRSSINPDDWAISFEFANDCLWIGTGSGLRIYDVKRGKFETSPLDSALQTMPSAKSQIRLCKKDRYGNVWVCINGLGIIIINSISKQPITTISVKELNSFDKTGILQFFSAVETDNKILFGTNQGLRSLEFDKGYQIKIDNNPSHSVASLNSDIINWLGKGPDDRVYVSSNNFYSLSITLADPVLYQEPIDAASNWLSSVRSGLFINNNLLLIGCKEGLAATKLSASPFESISNDIAFKKKLSHVFAIWPYSDDSIVAASNSGLYLITDRKKIQAFAEDNYYQNITPLIGDEVIISNPKGIKLMNRSGMREISSAYPELKPYQSWEINSCIKMNDSIFALGTENFRGILLWNFKTKKITHVSQFSFKLKIEADIVNTIYKDKQNNLWVLSDKTISIVNKNLNAAIAKAYLDSSSNLPAGLFFDMCESNGYFWIAAYGIGVIKLSSDYSIKRMFTTRDGLSNSGVYKIFNYKDQKLFVTTNNGLSVFNIASETFTNYYLGDGLHSNAFEEACGVYRNNKIYAGGINGFTIIDPAKITGNKIAPRLYIERLEIETTSGNIDTSNLLLKKISIPASFTQVKIHFAALNYFNPSRTTYKYKIAELHHDWINLQSQNFIVLIGLSPGIYHLQVQSFNEDGVPSEIKELTLVFLPKWYQTWWFKLLAVLAFVGAAYALYRMRINQLKKEQQIRTKLASDLHDDLGSTMNSVKVYTNLAILDKQQEKYLYKIKESTQEAISGIRDIIWVLDDSKNSIEHVLARINQFAAPLCDANHIVYKTEIADEARDFKLGQEEKRNIYMMMKEAINNATKYSNAKNIEVAIAASKGKLFVVVKDDGSGFDSKAALEGNGLKNMMRRAKEIKYKLNIVSQPGDGTSISIQKT